VSARISSWCRQRVGAEGPRQSVGATLPVLLREIEVSRARGRGGNLLIRSRPVVF
jgi:hypothetical protein